jgi:hypothetical protein
MVIRGIFFIDTGKESPEALPLASDRGRPGFTISEKPRRKHASLHHTTKTGGNMYVIVQHEISNPKTFWSL